MDASQSVLELVRVVFEVKKTVHLKIIKGVVSLTIEIGPTMDIKRRDVVNFSNT